MAATPMRMVRLNSDGKTVTVQGFTLDAPPSPTGQGGFITSPTSVQTVAKTQIEVQPGNDQPPLSSEHPPVFATVIAQFSWTAVYQAEAQSNPASQDVAVTTGVTSSQSQQESFASTIGFETGFDFDGISAKLNASFTETTGTETSISLENSTTTTNHYQVNAETTGQFWQLIQVFTADSGATLTQPLNFFLSLSFPP